MSVEKPLVSIICTCYNHELVLEDALRSVIDQIYSEIELIIIDDFSSDNSRSVINKFLLEYPDIQFIANDRNQGLCRNFNKALSLISGKYVVDLSGDDVLLPNRIECQVEFFEKLPGDYGVIYSNAELINLNRKFDVFYPVNNASKVINRPPEGDIYLNLIESCSIATQTMLMRRETLEELCGYDEDLSYEDFDFWIRSSRNWKYAYQDQILTQIRKLEGSLSTKQYNQDDMQLHSTFEVCKKIKTLNQTEEEDDALIRRLRYEIRHAVLAEKRYEANLFIELLSKMQSLSLSDRFFLELNKRGMKTAWLRNKLLKINS